MAEAETGQRDVAVRQFRTRRIRRGVAGEAEGRVDQDRPGFYLELERGFEPDVRATACDLYTVMGPTAVGRAVEEVGRGSAAGQRLFRAVSSPYCWPAFRGAMGEAVVFRDVGGDRWVFWSAGLGEFLAFTPSTSGRVPLGDRNRDRDRDRNRNRDHSNGSNREQLNPVQLMVPGPLGWSAVEGSVAYAASVTNTMNYICGRGVAMARAAAGDGAARASQLRLMNVHLQEEKGQLARRNEELERQNVELQRRVATLAKRSSRSHATVAGREEQHCEVPNCGWRGLSLAKHQGKARHGRTYRGAESGSATKRRKAAYQKEYRKRPRALEGGMSSEAP